MFIRAPHAPPSLALQGRRVRIVGYMAASRTRSNAWLDFVGVLDNTDVFFKLAKASLRHSDLH